MGTTHGNLHAPTDEELAGTNTVPAPLPVRAAGPLDFATTRDTATHRFVPRDRVTNEPLDGVFIDFYGEDTPEFKKGDDYAQSNLTRRARKKKMSGAGTLYSIEQLARIIAQWGGVVWQGEVMPYSVSNAELLFANVGWLREQASEFIRDREERLGKSEGSTGD